MNNQKIYAHHRDEFLPSMKGVNKLMIPLGIQETKVFSLNKPRKKVDEMKKMIDFIQAVYYKNCTHKTLCVGVTTPSSKSALALIQRFFYACVMVGVAVALDSARFLLGRGGNSVTFTTFILPLKVVVS